MSDVPTLLEPVPDTAGEAFASVAEHLHACLDQGEAPDLVTSGCGHYLDEESGRTIYYVILTSADMRLPGWADVGMRLARGRGEHS